jgi:hypothetical protein
MHASSRVLSRAGPLRVHFPHFQNVRTTRRPAPLMPSSPPSSTHPPTHPPIHTHTPRQHCGCSEVSAYPEGRHVITPNIAKLAKTSVVFERAYVSVGLCMPSRTALLTSRRPDTSRSWTIEPDQCVAYTLYSRRPARPNQNSDQGQAVIKATTACRQYQAALHR